MTSYTPDPRDLDGRVPPARHRGAADDDALAALARRARYSRWDGSQQVPDLGADEILDELSNDVMADGDLAEALRRLMERGWRSGDPTRPDLPGLQDLMDRLGRRREELRERFEIGDVLGDIRRELDEIVAQERAGVEGRLERSSGAPPDAPAPAPGASGDEAADGPSNAADPDLQKLLRDVAAKRLDQLDALPRDVGARIRDLREYDFLEPDARARFDELVERLGKQVLDQFVGGMSDAIRSMTPEDLAANREMVRDLNELIRERIGGGDPDVRDFLAKHGRFFPGAQSFDDIIDQLAQRMAAMQSLMRSMSPEQRAELESMMEALLRDDRLLLDLAELASNLDMLMPGGLGDRVRFDGEESLTLDGALAQIARLQAMERLEDALTDVDAPGDLADIDRDQVRELLGDDAVRDLEVLDDLARRLEEAGYLTRDGEHLELTPRGSRKIGQKVLDDLFARLERDAFGGHRLDRGGRGGEREETTKPFEFGDPFHLDLRGTLAQCARSRGERAGPPWRPRGSTDRRRLRGLPDRAAHPDGDRAPGRHEPVHAPARLLPGGQEGRGRARHADPDAVPA